MAEMFENFRNHLLPLYVIGVDTNKVQEPVDRPNGYPSYQISICLEGKGIYIDENNVEHVIETGDLFMFSPYTPHRYKAITERWILPFIVFTGQYCGSIMDYLRLGKSLVIKNISDDDFNKINVYFSKIYNQYFSTMEMRTAYASSLTYSLLVFIAEIYISKSKKHSKIPSQLSPALNYIRYHINEDISVDTLADIIGVSTGRLSVLFKESFGMSPVQIIRKYKLGMAKHLLDAKPNIKIKEVAKQCGFASTSYFVTAFKKEFNISPRDYRNGNPTDYIW